MAKSKFEYVKSFEQDDRLLPNTWIVVRLDGRGFTKFTEAHGFVKPNDERALQLMNECALAVMRDFGDVVAAYGESDEYSFVMKRSTQLYGRRASKIVTAIVSTFTATYSFCWSRFMTGVTLQYPATFDGRAVCYPSDQNLRDYLSWRQADCHINNLYNTLFWALVHAGMSNQDANKEIHQHAASSGQKNEMLFSRFSINYNNVSALYRKGTVIIRVASPTDSDNADSKRPPKKQLTVLHDDIIGDAFWQTYPDILKDS